MPSIVTVNVSLQQAPLPSTLQQTGAFVSVGGSTLAPGTLSSPITQMADLTSILRGGNAISAITWTTNVATVTTAAPHNFTNGQTIELTIAGVTPIGYNGTFACTITGASSFTYPLTPNPGGPATVPGIYTPEDVAELLAMGTTFFAQGSNQVVYVLELGAVDTTDAVAVLTTYLNNNPQTLYGVLVPRTFDANAAFLSLIASYESTTSLFYFWVTTTTGTYSSYTALMKDVFALIEAPGIPALEFSLAAAFYQALQYNPSTTNKATPFAFKALFGVTPYPTSGNQSLLTTLKTNNINVVLTGAEGGLTNTFLFWGTMKDGRDFLFWFAVDWIQIQSKIALANEVINGSNTPLNPLDYDQPGVNRLQAREFGVITDAIIFGLATGTAIQTELDGTQLANALNTNSFVNQAVVNAVPFVTYATENPSDYRIGKYTGLSVVVIIARGFTQIVLNIVATDFVTF